MGRVNRTLTGCPSCCPGFQRGSLLITSMAAWSRFLFMPLRIVGSDISPLLFTTNRMITRPSVCQSIAFCGYSRLSLIKESNASVPPGNSGMISATSRGVSDVSEAVVELSFV